MSLDRALVLMSEAIRKNRQVVRLRMSQEFLDRIVAEVAEAPHWDDPVPSPVGHFTLGGVACVVDETVDGCVVDIVEGD